MHDVFQSTMPDHLALCLALSDASETLLRLSLGITGPSTVATELGPLLALLEAAASQAEQTTLAVGLAGEQMVVSTELLVAAAAASPPSGLSSLASSLHQLARDTESLMSAEAPDQEILASARERVEALLVQLAQLNVVAPDINALH